MIRPVSVERPGVPDSLLPVRCVNPEEFLQYALSRNRWERTEDAELGLTGLTSPDSNDSVFVESVELDRFRLLSS